MPRALFILFLSLLPSLLLADSLDGHYLATLGRPTRRAAPAQPGAAGQW